MKHICSLILLICLLLPQTGRADSMISIRQLNEHPPSRWTRTYQTTWREVSVDVAPYVPQAEDFPVLKLSQDFTVPDISGLSEKWASGMREDGLFNISLDDYDRAETEAKGNTQTLVYYPPFDFNNFYAEHNDLTIGECIDHLKQIMITTGYGDWRYDSPHELLVNLTTSKKSGEVLIPEGYSFMLKQMIVGIPILGHVLEGIDDPKDGIPGMRTFMVYQVRKLDAINIRGQKLRQIEILEQDVPLMDFSVIQKSIEQEITEGRIRKIFDVELGYALYNEPGASIGRGDEWRHMTLYYGLPMWAVRCHYVNSPTKELRDYTGMDVEERSMTEYKTVLFNAQTGKVIDRLDNRREVSDYPGFISWEEAGGRP